MAVRGRRGGLLLRVVGLGRSECAIGWMSSCFLPLGRFIYVHAYLDYLYAFRPSRYVKLRR